MSSLNPLQSSSWIDPGGFFNGDPGLLSKDPGQQNPYDPPFQPAPFNPLIDMNQLSSTLNNIPVDMSGINAYRSQALRSGPSTWASLQKTQNAQKMGQQKEQATQQAATTTAQTEADLASHGGLSSGARERAAEGGATNAMNMQQEIQRQGNLNDLQTGINDETNRIQQLGALPGLENTATQPLFQKAQILTNAGMAENQAANQYNENLYNTNMSGYGANQSANAQIASAPSGPFAGLGCCFIFLEARYGNGTMDKVVRRYRDEKMTPKNRRGYYKLAEVLVPMMRHSKIAKGLVIVTMTSPLVMYGKAYYGEGSKLGFVFKPLVKGWLKFFDFLGGDHPFIRENGETV